MTAEHHHVLTCDLAMRSHYTPSRQHFALIKPASTNDSASTVLPWLFSSLAGIDVNKAAAQCNLDQLRHLASIISQRALQCHQVHASFALTDIRFCGWQSDLVSDQAARNFEWEKHLWRWVVRAFKRELFLSQPCISDPLRCRSIGFLDIGANIGDWLTPLRLSLPYVPILGVEGSPANVALATANIAESVRHVRQTSMGQVAPTRIMPYAMLSPVELRAAHHAGGLCFSRGLQKTSNIGEHGLPLTVDDHHTLRAAMQSCPIKAQVAGTTLGTVLQTMSVPPSVFIVKMDIEGHELHALSTIADAWSERPPCFVIIEFTMTGPSQAWSNATLRMLVHSTGYDAMWLNVPGSDSQWSRQPPAQPSFVAQQGLDRNHLETAMVAGLQREFNQVAVAWEVAGKRSRYDEWYLDAIVGFRERQKCIRSLLSG
eukprot:CAMPEP_0119339416 /NCGR_PEP_ID=MMETSP1333-20130426/98206_1 /TAXON_ID=418940 /ORGANISM="Scyphosphaera apsteinii, Strain RCC1455" /LENGTH=428 /DNA_ID=CAMNT_0007350923 /DNA_START=158 /DNA_END=1440 /DNA_ORIENTATION=+